MNSKKKKDIKGIIATIIFILVVIGAIAWYPWFTSIDENKETHCKNIFGYEFSCKEKNYP